jgi:hypothetical protein
MSATVLLAVYASLLAGLVTTIMEPVQGLNEIHARSARPIEWAGGRMFEDDLLIAQSDGL